jgi:prophage regulatory protein
MQAASLNEKDAAGRDRRPATPVDDELWSLKTVLARTALSRSSIYSYVELGLFPRQRRLGPRRVGWLASEVRAWIASRPV